MLNGLRWRLSAKAVQMEPSCRAWASCVCKSPWAAWAMTGVIPSRPAVDTTRAIFFSGCMANLQTVAKGATGETFHLPIRSVSPCPPPHPERARSTVLRVIPPQMSEKSDFLADHLHATRRINQNEPCNLPDISGTNQDNSFRSVGKME